MSNNGADSSSPDISASSVRNVNLQDIVNKGRNRGGPSWEGITDILI